MADWWKGDTRWRPSSHDKDASKPTSEEHSTAPWASLRPTDFANRTRSSVPLVSSGPPRVSAVEDSSDVGGLQREIKDLVGTNQDHSPSRSPPKKSGESLSTINDYDAQSPTTPSRHQTAETSQATSRLDSSAGDVSVTLDLELEEDVAANLDHYVLLSRQGYFALADNFFEVNLKRHLYWFPVVMERINHKLPFSREGSSKEIESFVSHVLHVYQYGNKETQCLLLAMSLPGLRYHEVQKRFDTVLRKIDATEIDLLSINMMLETVQIAYTRYPIISTT